MSETEHSDVPSQALSSRVVDAVAVRATDEGLWDRAKAEARPEDDGDQALMRGFKPHVRLFVRGCLGLEAGVDRQNESGYRPRSVCEGSPAMASPPPLHECWFARMCRRARCLFGCRAGAIGGSSQASWFRGNLTIDSPDEGRQFARDRGRNDRRFLSLPR